MCSLGKWERNLYQVFHKDTRIPEFPALMVTGKMGEGNNIKNNNLDRNKRATVVTAINGTAAMYQAQM